MFGREKPEVLVVGAGPVGLFAALVLCKRGVRVQVVDREFQRTSRSYACALHADSLRRLEEFGLLSGILGRARHIRSVCLHDRAELKAEMKISELAEDYSFLAVVRQGELEEQLEDAVEKAGGRVLWSHEASQLAQHGDGVSVTLDRLTKDSRGYAVPHTEWVVSKSRKVEVPFVIGADGHDSRTRRALGIAFPEVGECQDFAVFEFGTSPAPGHEMHLVLDEGAASVFWPLTETHCRWSFQIPIHDTSWDTREKDRLIAQLGHAASPVLSEEFLSESLQERAPWFKGSVEAIRWRAMVRFERRVADSFGNGRVWLAGDAGHVTAPAGVQSMNVGLREAQDLAETIARVLKGEAGATELAAYNEARRAEWQFLLGVAGGLTPREGTDPWIRERSASLLSCIPASGDDLARLAAQLGLDTGSRLTTGSS